MPEALVRHPHPAIGTEGGERLARAELRRQIGRLEGRLAGLFTEAFPRTAIDAGVPAPSRGPRLIGLGELEQVRDALASRVAVAQEALRERRELEAQNRALLERMLVAPESFKWLRISRADVGEPGCGAWHSRPRFGLLGMLMGWWQVKVSSGCPLPGRLAAVPRQGARKTAGGAGCAALASQPPEVRPWATEDIRGLQSRDPGRADLAGP